MQKVYYLKDTVSEVPTITIYTKSFKETIIIIVEKTEKNCEL